MILGIAIAITRADIEIPISKRRVDHSIDRLVVVIEGGGVLETADAIITLEPDRGRRADRIGDLAGDLQFGRRLRRA